MQEKTFKVVRAANLKMLIEAANNMRITKDTFIAIIPPSLHGGEFSLVYFN